MKKEKATTLDTDFTDFKDSILILIHAIREIRV